MNKIRYEVRDGKTGDLLGLFEELDFVFAFIKGFKMQYYNEKLSLVIKEIVVVTNDD